MSFFFRIFWLSLFVKLLISYFLPLLPDEAYYWIWSHNLQLSYYDHPPMIAWLFRLGHFLEPWGHAVRFPAVIFLHLSLFIWRGIFDELRLSQESFQKFLLFLLLVPYLGLGSIILTPDLPLMFFWPLSFYFFIRILNSTRARDYALLGISLGLGFLSKYHIVLFLICAILYLTLEKQWQRVKWKYVTLTVLAGLICCSPVIIWNINNGFQSFVFQLEHGLKATRWKWVWPIEYFFGQLLMLLPPLGYYLLKEKKQTSQKLFFYFTIGILGFFLVTSFKSSVEMNWTLMAFPMFFAFISISDVPEKIIRAVFAFLILFNVFLLGSMFSGVHIHGKIFEPFFFESQKDKVSQYSPMYGINYQISSSLWYFSKQPVFKITDASRFDFFDTLNGKRPSEKTIYVFKEERNEYPDWINDLKPKTEIVEKLERGYVIERLEFE